ncbi:MAG TPA: glycosyltransferase family 2 protein [Chloroflexia bacterium]|nr:glycosyltransferase family 2 protein [Chloroflexia bacterium]
MSLDYPISIIVPAYNSEAILPELAARLEVVLKGGWPGSSESELIIVNDGSRDGSWEAIRRLAETYPWVRGVNLMRNYGQHNALLCGIRLARHGVIVTMDDDLQHPPEEVHKLLEKLDEGYDVVYGTPQKEQHGLWRDMASRATKMALQSSMGAETARNVSAFRAFRARVRDAFAEYRSPFVSIDVLLTWGTTRFTHILVRHDPRKSGVSNYTFRKLLSHAINMATGFSTLPLQLASLVGFTFTLFGLVMLIYVIVRYVIEGGSVPGFPFLASAIAIFSGAQLFALGIIGEYLARMHFRMMERPTYVVSTTVQSDEAESGVQERG